MPAYNLFYCRLKVTRDPASDLPQEYAGAYVPAFAAAEDHQKALGLIIPGLGELGWVFEELVNHRVDEMEADLWDDFIEATWPELKDALPDHARVLGLLAEGGWFHGPMAVWSQ